MKTLITTTVLIVNIFLSVLANAQCADADNIYSFTHDGKNYQIIKELKTWTEAAACAVERGGYLVHIERESEQTAIYNAILASGISPTYKPIANGGGISYIWIGGTDRKTESTWDWDGDNDGTGNFFWIGEGVNGAGNGMPASSGYINWGGKSAGSVQEPDDYNNDQDGAAMALAGWPNGTTNLGIAGEWNDIITSSSIYYIVEYDGAINKSNTLESEIDVKIFPNPSKGTFSVNISESPHQNLKMEILNSYGKLIHYPISMNSNSMTIDLTGKPVGMYFLKLYTHNELLVKKLLLVK